MAEPLLRAVILQRHRALLQGLQEFWGGLAEGGEGVPDLDALRGAVAFLRHEVLPFSGWEEGVLLRDEEEWETTSFEHAFLRAEVDALAREVMALDRSAERWEDAPERDAGAARVLRGLHRIEVIFELHLQRGEDRGIVVKREDDTGAVGRLG